MCNEKGDDLFGRKDGGKAIDILEPDAVGFSVVKVTEEERGKSGSAGTSC